MNNFIEIFVGLIAIAIDFMLMICCPTLAIFIFFAGICSVYEIVKEKLNTIVATLLSSFTGIILFPICMMIGISGIALIMSSPTEQNGIVAEYTYDLVNIADNRYYVVHRRDVNNSDVYDYLIDHGEYIKSYTAKRSDCHIIETENKPKMIMKVITFKSKIRKFLSLNRSTTLYDFYIPKGSVTRDFTIDLN